MVSRRIIHQEMPPNFMPMLTVLWPVQLYIKRLAQAVEVPSPLRKV